MSDLRTAAQQALEALEYENSWHAHHKVKPYASTIDAITALKAALEQPTPAGEADMRVYDAIADNYKAALEQPEQEPVATVAMDVSRAHLSWGGKYLGQRPDMKIAMLLKDLPVGTLLYTNPPRREWRSLSEEEILPLYSLLPSSHAEMLEFARAIEAALRSKNHE
jgi:hypothetical protein